MKRWIGVLIVTALMVTSLAGCENMGNALGTEATLDELTMNMPENFVRDAKECDDETEVYNYENGSASYVMIQKTTKEGNIETDSGAMKREKESLYKNLGADVDIEVQDTKEYEIDGHLARRYSLSYTLWENPIKEMHVEVEGTEYFYYVTFVEIGEEGCWKLFRPSANSITVK